MRRILLASEISETGPSPFIILSKREEEEVPWYFREDITSTYETWYEGRYKKADIKEKAILRKGIDWIGDVKTIFEVGCGTAHFTRYFEEIGIDAFGVDPSTVETPQGIQVRAATEWEVSS
jgi:SAM-dependent methyltransferase